MSRNQFLELLAYASPLVLGAIFLLLPPEEDPNIQRLPASIGRTIGATPMVLYPGKNINYDKLSKLITKKTMKNELMKAKGNLQVSIELLDNFEEGAPFSLKAHVTASQSIQYADVMWTLGPGLEVIAGIQKNVLYNLNSKTPVEDEITLQKTTDGLPARVFFHVSYVKNGKVYAQTGYYSSQHQTTVVSKSTKKVFSQPLPHGSLKVMY